MKLETDTAIKNLEDFKCVTFEDLVIGFRPPKQEGQYSFYGMIRRVSERDGQLTAFHSIYPWQLLQVPTLVRRGAMWLLNNDTRLSRHLIGDLREMNDALAQFDPGPPVAPPRVNGTDSLHVC